MKTNLLSCVADLSNDALLSSVQDLAKRERCATAALVAALAEVDARGLYRGAGFSSLFAYCTEILHLSEHEAYDRIEVARAVRRFPLALKRLAEGAVHLTAIRLLAQHLTAENHRELFDAAQHKTRRQVEELVARIRPLPPVPSSIRKLPEVPAPRAVLAEPAAQPTPPPAPTSASRRPAVTPLAPETYKVQFTVSAATLEKLRVAQALLRHQIPDGDPATVFDRALDALVADLARKKLAATDHPREGSPTAPGSRHIPAVVKRAVWHRDGGRCAFVAKTGRRCEERGFLEFHHVRPYATGGEATESNVEIRCKVHNGYEAELYFGPEVIRRAHRTDELVSNQVALPGPSTPPRLSPSGRGQGAGEAPC